MDDERNESDSARKWLIVAPLFAMPVLYVLSTGPAVLLRDRGVITQDSFLCFYLPVAWAIQHLSYFHVALNFYLELWNF